MSWRSKLTVFWITIEGKGVQIKGDNNQILDVGFFREIVLRADDLEAAKSTALRWTEDDLLEQGDEGFVNLNGLSLWIDDVVKTRQFWKRTKRQGFVFFPNEG